MIRVTARNFTTTCQQRGYDVAAAMACVVAQDGNLWTVDETHPAYPRVRKRQGLGDMVAAGLSAVGITPERVSAALGVKDCGCKKRQQKLNELGRRIGIG
jgi:hypothetical protein